MAINTVFHFKMETNQTLEVSFFNETPELVCLHRFWRFWRKSQWNATSTHRNLPMHIYSECHFTDYQTQYVHIFSQTGTECFNTITTQNKTRLCWIFHTHICKTILEDILRRHSLTQCNPWPHTLTLTKCLTPTLK